MTIKTKYRLKQRETYTVVGSVKGQTQKAVTWSLHHQRSESTRGSLHFCNTFTRTRRLKGAPRLDALSRKWQRIFQSRATCRRLQPLWHPLFCPLSLTQGKAPVPTAQERVRGAFPQHPLTCFRVSCPLRAAPAQSRPLNSPSLQLPQGLGPTLATPPAPSLPRRPEAVKTGRRVRVHARRPERAERPRVRGGLTQAAGRCRADDGG